MKRRSVRKTAGAAISVIGVAVVVAGALGASADAEPRYSVEVVPIEAAASIEVEDLGDSAASDEISDLVDRAVVDLAGEYPQLGKMTVGELVPVYRDEDPSVIGVAFDLILSEPTDLTMELQATIIDGKGEPVAQPQLAQVNNLRGLTVQVSIKTGEIMNLVPLPFLDDVERPNETTTVDFLIPEQTRMTDIELEEE